MIVMEYNREEHGECALRDERTWNSFFGEVLISSFFSFVFVLRILSGLLACFIALATGTEKLTEKLDYKFYRFDLCCLGAAEHRSAAAQSHDG